MAKIDSDANISGIRMIERANDPASPSSGYRLMYMKTAGLFVIDSNGNIVGPLGASTGGGYTEGARVYNNANISVSSGQDTILTFNQERFDTDGIHDGGTNPGRLTCNTAGKYIIVGQVVYAAGTGDKVLRIRLNGSTVIAYELKTPSPDNMLRISVSTIYDLSIGNYVELVAYHENPSSVNINSVGNYSPEFMMQRIG